MKLPSLTRLYKGDFKQEFQELVDKMGGIINENTERLYELGNKKISLRDNVLCTVRDFVVQVDANGVPLTRTTVALDAIGKVEGVSVIYTAANRVTGVYPTNQPFIGYTPQASSINIDVIKGLSTGYEWTIRIIIWQS